MLDFLKIFLEVIEFGSFSRVASVRRVAVSSISRTMDQLEAEIGAKLFQRNSRSMTLTDAGQKFLPRAQLLIAELDEAKSELSSLRSDPTGLLTVTAPSAFGRKHVVPTLAKFLKLYPQIALELELSDRYEDLAARRIDVALRIGVLTDSDLIKTRLAPTHRLVCASPDYLEREGTPKNPQDLLNHNCLTIAARTPPNGLWQFEGVNRNAPLAIRGNFRSDDVEALVIAAVRGLGIVHLGSWLVGDFLESGHLVNIFPKKVKNPAKIQSAIHAVRMPGRSHEVKAQLFVNHLKHEFGNPPYWDNNIG